MANYVYLIGPKEGHSCAVVDPGWDAAFIFEQAEKSGRRVEAAFATHNHFDHIGAIGQLLEKADIPIYIHKLDADPLRKIAGKNIRETSGGDSVPIGNLVVSLLHTPGHTAGSQCLAIDEKLLTGDTLFIDGCGRVDLPSSDPAKMADSLKKISNLPAETALWPGHNYAPAASDTLARQLRTNAYLAAARRNLDDFLRLIGG
ncbi:MAG: MBL fold metallo-hydrolase [Elusimicrobiota bacterium]